MLDLAASGDLLPLDDYLDVDALKETLVPGPMEATEQGGHTFGTPVRVADKSIVWYQKRAFDELGYEVPSTLDELVDLTERIRADGIAPWCMAWGADAATGWVGTDWIEQLVLALQGPDYYQDWAQHRMPFDDDGVVQAFEEFGSVARTRRPGARGGRKRVLDTAVAESMHPAFATRRSACWSGRAASRLSFLPSEVQREPRRRGRRVPVPGRRDTVTHPTVLGGADLAALVNGGRGHRRRCWGSSPPTVRRRVGAGRRLAVAAPHLRPSDYPNETTRRIAAADHGARRDWCSTPPTSCRPEVGAGTFWTGMVEWINGKSSAATAADIEASWPN